MHIQKSFENKEKGNLYIVPTPIGNLEDITYRALRTLKEVDIIAAEDTRQTQKLLNHFEISTFTMSYHEHNKESAGRKILDYLQAQKNVALVSDAGMPVISDPGFEIISQANQLVNVIVLPGANAALCALVGSGLSAEQFYFYGFLPRKKKEMKAVLDDLRYIKATLVFYESPHRIKETLKGLKNGFGPNRKVAVARELTKRYEEYVRGTIDEILQWIESEESQIRGEFCIVVEGSKEEKTEEENWWEHLSIIEHVNAYIQNHGMTNKDAIKNTAKDRNIQKREVYQIFHQS
ncbi:16S rRNA (cytidine1402-2'-O)-methyltransferase [Salinibacillus kushneri]|uniref:Ribosomal RNA small subunit methyltransferase I n=1 Tax=Salinibacillus kushneri TaxID=237682 RepID=A0A1I0JAE0_9BACI|nr:16S rRNA (cytidine(1402)-2'-O)-methyltransferase [Salinibacillus kushneri]SEU06873.1 16S rRNA (cytidine1402-2'-O)-methyltransferase [Salinibacillus kushneri]